MSLLEKKGNDEEIEIPSSMLKMLVAEDIRSYKINKLEQAESNELLGLPIDYIA